MADSKRLSRKAIRAIVAGSLVVWAVLSIVGFLIGFELTSSNRVIAGAVGVMLAGAVWVVLCWTFGLTARGVMSHRGYDLSPQRR